MIDDWNPTKDDLLKVERLINTDQLEYDDIKSEVIYLRDFYTQFSGDATRVSSARIMASKFVEELQDLLKIISKR